MYTGLGLTILYGRTSQGADYPLTAAIGWLPVALHPRVGGAFWVSSRNCIESGRNGILTVLSFYLWKWSWFCLLSSLSKMSLKYFFKKQCNWLLSVSLFYVFYYIYAIINGIVFLLISLWTCLLQIYKKAIDFCVDFAYWSCSIHFLDIIVLCMIFANVYVYVVCVCTFQHLCACVCLSIFYTRYHVISEQVFFSLSTSLSFISCDVVSIHTLALLSVLCLFLCCIWNIRRCTR